MPWCSFVCFGVFVSFFLYLTFIEHLESVVLVFIKFQNFVAIIYLNTFCLLSLLSLGDSNHIYVKFLEVFPQLNDAMFNFFNSLFFLSSNLDSFYC